MNDNNYDLVDETMATTCTCIGAKLVEMCTAIPVLASIDLSSSVSVCTVVQVPVGLYCSTVLVEY